MRDDVLKVRDAPQAHRDPDALEDSYALEERDAPRDSDAPQDRVAFEDGDRFPHTCTHFAGGGGWGGGGAKGRTLSTHPSSLKAIGLGSLNVCPCVCMCVHMSVHVRTHVFCVTPPVRPT